MADTAKKVPNKRKGPGPKPISPKKPKLENAKKQNFTPKVKQENSSPKKPFLPKVKAEKNADGKPHNKGKPKPGAEKKPFAGTKNLKVAENTETKKKSRRSVFSQLKGKLNDPASQKAIIDDLEKKIQDIKARDGPLSKTAKKKIRMFAKFIEIAKGNPKPEKVVKKGPKTEAAKKPAQNGNIAKKAKTAVVQKKKVKKEEEEEEEEEDEDEEVSGEEEEGDSDDEADSDDEEGDSGEEDDDDDDDGSDEDDIFQESDEEEKKPPKEAKPARRYVCFVGNLPYDTTVRELTEYFKKCGPVKHVRIPFDKTTNKPRGFGYVELTDHETYEKCMSMHHTFLKGRRINVLYTNANKNAPDATQKAAKIKELKLKALSRQGKLHGSKKLEQRRSFRRNKQTQQTNEEN